MNKQGTMAHARPPVDLDAAADQAIAACGGDARGALKALIVANDFLEAQLDELRANIDRLCAGTASACARTQG
jgi:hypothetical protein